MVAKSGKGWVLAPCLVSMAAEADAIAPGRSKANDGSIASVQHHQQNPTSDHEVRNGLVTALDLTNDPAGGFDAEAMTERIVARRDRRVKYLICNRRIWRSYDKPGLPAWTPAPYTGPDPHTNHLHCSVLMEEADTPGPWWPDQEDDLMGAREDILDAIAGVRKELLEADEELQRRIDNTNMAVAGIVQDGVKVDARSIAAAIPDAYAAEVADELAKRLKG